MTESQLQDEYSHLILPRFAEAEALMLGITLLRLAEENALAVVIDIRTADRTLFHAALPGAAPNNDNWARRKSNTALMFQMPSLLVGERHRAKGETLERSGLSQSDYSDHGGAVPIRVAGCGVVAVATVSGLPSRDDHALVVTGIRMLMGA